MSKLKSFIIWGEHIKSSPILQSRNCNLFIDTSTGYIIGIQGYRLGNLDLSGSKTYVGSIGKTGSLRNFVITIELQIKSDNS